MKINREQLNHLVRLQDIEIDIAHIKTQLGQVNEKMQALGLRLEAFQKVIENEKSELEALKAYYLSLESGIQTHMEKIRRSREKLRLVKTNKEYKSSLKEIEELDDMNSKIEDQMLECLDRIEAVENNIASQQIEYSKLYDEVDAEKEMILLETRTGKKRLERLEKDRMQMMSQIDSVLIARFKTIQDLQPTGIAVAPAKDSVCLGCHMNIPPQLYNELQRCDSLMYCPYCERILYWKES